MLSDSCHDRYILMTCCQREMAMKIAKVDSEVWQHDHRLSLVLALASSLTTIGRHDQHHIFHVLQTVCCSIPVMMRKLTF
jgi:hypothetical protein